MRRRDLLGILVASACAVALAGLGVLVGPGDGPARPGAPTVAVGPARPAAALAPSSARPVTLTPRRVATEPEDDRATPPAAATPVGPPGPPTTPEEKLALDLGLTRDETERVAEAIRAADVRLRADMAALAERGYDDVAARHLGERFEEELLASVEAALPAARRPAFRALMERTGR